MENVARPSAETPYASVSSRLIAFAVDAVLLTAILYCASLILTALRGPVVSFQPLPDAGSQVSIDHGRLLATAGVSAALSALYFIGGWVAGAATPGQRLFHIGVHRVDGRSLTMRQAFARWLLLVGPISLGALAASALTGLRASLDLSTLLWYLVLIVTTIRSLMRQGLHDRLAGSIVTRGAHPARPAATPSR